MHNLEYDQKLLLRFAQDFNNFLESESEKLNLDKDEIQQLLRSLTN